MSGSPRGNDGLTDLQRNFAYLLALPNERGRSRGLEEAFRESHPDFTGKYAKQSAWALTQNPVVAAKISELKAEFLEQLKFQVQNVGLTVKERRIAEKQWRYDKLKDLIYELSEAHGGESPGGSTGFLTKNVKGAAGKLVTIYEFQGEILAEMMKIEDSIAKELGQLEDLQTVTNVAITLSDEERATRIATIFDEGRTRRDRFVAGSTE